MKLQIIFVVLTYFIQKTSGQCADNPDYCDSNASCTPVVGVPDTFECVCNAGYAGDGQACSDINECSGTNLCSSNATCTDIDGCYTCTCNNGFMGDGFTCTDIDECSDESLNFCDNQATCTNNNGCYTCTCNEGFEGDGVMCLDTDECGMYNDCEQPNMHCVNTIGGYGCDCDTGYVHDGDDCVDENECDAIPCDTNAVCTNTEGSFTCVCQAGFIGDGFTCVAESHYGETCANGEVCVDPDTECSSGVCDCIANYEYNSSSCVYACENTYSTLVDILLVCIDTPIHYMYGTVAECQTDCNTHEDCLSISYLKTSSFCQLFTCDQTTAVLSLSVTLYDTYSRDCSPIAP